MPSGSANDPLVLVLRRVGFMVLGGVKMLAIICYIILCGGLDEFIGFLRTLMYQRECFY